MSRRMRAALVSLVFLTAGTAAAGDAYRHSDSIIVAKSPEEIWKISTAYSETCEKGCKYYRKDVVAIRKLSYKASSTRWYTWTHMSPTLKDVKYFTEVSLEKKAGGHFVANSRQLDDSDKELLKTLEEKTGLDHSAAFDKVNSRLSTESAGEGKTKVEQLVTLTASGMVAMWPGKIRDGMKGSVDQTLKNFQK